ncbi:MAG: hypothetical protein CL429_03780 [Acidimicrobiaceae bacterium]|nr:hypothetical protein [Acidimicrobiaceae bacterium]|tara:strand:- start:493 stop:699 length:207 start_codon:yes stop_codon:yes gene_type:complete
MANNSSDTETRNILAENYAVRLVEDMDMNTLVELTTEYLSNQFKTYELEELAQEIEENGCYDDLLEQE